MLPSCFHGVRLSSCHALVMPSSQDFKLSCSRARALLCCWLMVSRSNSLAIPCSHGRMVSCSHTLIGWCFHDPLVSLCYVDDRVLSGSHGLVMRWRLALRRGCSHATTLSCSCDLTLEALHAQVASGSHAPTLTWLHGRMRSRAHAITIQCVHPVMPPCAHTFMLPYPRL